MDAWEETFDYLIHNGPKIGEDYLEGDKKASRVMSLYGMYCPAS